MERQQNKEFFNSVSKYSLENFMSIDVNYSLIIIIKPVYNIYDFL